MSDCYHTVKKGVGRLGRESVFLPVVLCILLPFFAAVFFVSPFYETAIDDDFAYFAMAQHLSETGEFWVSSWAEALPVFQVYWGTLFCKFFGQSFGVLRFSALCLILPGLLAMYFFAKDSGLDRWTAGFVPLAFFSAPLVLENSFSFNTDITSVSLLFIALLCYVRAIRRCSVLQMFLSSAVATAAIFTRQSCVAIIPAFFIVWLADRESGRSISLCIVGLALPIWAFIWQLYQRFCVQNWATVRGDLAHKAYLADSWGVITNVFYRLVSIFQYSGLFLMALTPVLLVFLWRIVKGEETGGIALRKTLPVIFVAGVTGIILNTFFGNVGLLLPNLIWYFSGLQNSSLYLRMAVTVVAFVCSCAVVACLCLRIKEIWRERNSPDKWLLDAVSLFFVIQILVWYKIGDRYMVSLIPWALIFVFKYIRPNRVLVGGGLCFVPAGAMCSFAA